MIYGYIFSLQPIKNKVNSLITDTYGYITPYAGKTAIFTPHMYLK
jgi:hypothetical protein